MAKVLRCNDLMPGCPFEAHGNTENEVLAKAADHAKTAHNISEIPPAMMSQVRGAIHDDSSPQPLKS
jgi:predicted small metal-binding protein